MEYKSSMTSASLAADGRIHCAVSSSYLLLLLHTGCSTCNPTLLHDLKAWPHNRGRPLESHAIIGSAGRSPQHGESVGFFLQVAGRNMTFESPSAFSIFLKRLVNPARKADDGWKTVKYNGRFLEQFKLELARRRLGMGSDDANSGITHSTMPLTQCLCYTGGCVWHDTCHPWQVNAANVCNKMCSLT